MARLRDFGLSTMVLAAWVLAASPAQAKRPKPLADGAEAGTFVLAQDVRAYTMVTMEKQTAYYLAKACRYTQAFKDGSGDYYIAEPGCLQQQNIFSDGRTIDYPGGIWISARPGKPARMFGVVGMDKQTCINLQPLLCMLGRMEVGRFRLVPGKMNPDAAEAIASALSLIPAGDAATRASRSRQPAPGPRPDDARPSG